MKLQVALVFGEHMVLQRDREIPVWGRCAGDDEITVELGGNCVTVGSDNGQWKAVLPAMKACEKTEMRISSKLTEEVIEFRDVAVGEVWLAGGQSNMEFLMKYEVNAEAMKQTEDDDLLRFFNYPQVPFLGYLEKEPCPDWGFWRKWKREEDRMAFSAVGAYMGRILRKELGVPVAILGCNWGGTPASAWTAMEDIENNPKLAQVLKDYHAFSDKLDLSVYYPSSEKPNPVQTPEQKAFFERFMMGEDMSKFFANMAEMPRPDPNIYNTYPLSPRSATRPAGVYEYMLCKVAPYPIKGVIWYQGEDDDARGWADFYDESMVTMISCWRRLWGYDFPFFQVELAPFAGRGFSASKNYDVMRQKQYEATLRLKDVYDVCILDVGEEFNIHPRRKKQVGERLGRMAMKHVYGDQRYVADNPRAAGAVRDGNRITVTVNDSAEGLHCEGDISRELVVLDGENQLPAEARVSGNQIEISGDFASRGKLEVRYCWRNCPEAVVFNSEGNPLYGFCFEV